MSFVNDVLDGFLFLLVVLGPAAQELSENDTAHILLPYTTDMSILNLKYLDPKIVNHQFIIKKETTYEDNSLNSYRQPKIQYRPYTKGKKHEFRLNQIGLHGRIRGGVQGVRTYTPFWATM